MVPPTTDGGSPAPIDRPILEFLQTRLQATGQDSRATVTDASGHLELHIVFCKSYYPAAVDDAALTIRWYTNDDFKIHYREQHAKHDWECRWDRHPNPHNTRDHFHPPPTAPTRGEDGSWPNDHRDVVELILNEIEDRIAALWNESATHGRHRGRGSGKSVERRERAVCRKRPGHERQLTARPKRGYHRRFRPISTVTFHHTRITRFRVDAPPQGRPPGRIEIR